MDQVGLIVTLWVALFMKLKAVEVILYKGPG